MSRRESYQPGPAAGAEIQKDGDNWTLVVVRELRHPPDKVWSALVDPAQLKEWAPFDADRRLDTAGAVALTTVGAPPEHQAPSRVKRAEAPRLLEYSWGPNDLHWQLEPLGTGTRLTLWHNIDKKFIAMGAAGWHICLDALDHLVAGDPIGRRVGPEQMKFDGWQQLLREYSQHFKIELPSWGTPAAG